ncbi:transposase [Chryseobacterium sp. CH21]|uniref:transposase n=1 Tax=Chryseobacterium sp. CH21 TaxID=713556 RepID=UPI00100B5CB5|nr:transposase [Chryseobacterium sp. CH21]RXM39731.1 transposase [Chryseobacterium sp. CH21]
MENYKEIHIGSLIKQRVYDLQISMSRICSFFNCTPMDAEKMFNSKDLYTNDILKWSKLLEYDFFRIYTQHLILFSPPNACFSPKKPTGTLPNFRKNIYTKEIINYIIEQITNETKTKQQIIEEYRIPKTTLYKWITKHSKIKNDSRL